MQNKRVKIFDFLKEKLGRGVLFIQETHSIPADKVPWSNELGFDIFLNNGESNARGTLTLVLPRGFFQRFEPRGGSF